MSAAAVGGLSTVGGKDFFLKLLLAELKNQDPMEPLSNTDMMTQLAQLTTVESISQLSANFSEMLRLQQLTGGVSLIGRQVQYRAEDGPQNGTVEAISSRDGKIWLRVGATEVGLDDILQVI